MKSSMSFLKRIGIPVLAILLLPSLALAQYTVTNLVSNQPGVAPNTDADHLINAWGLVSTTTSPFWVSDNGTGFSTLYNGAGTQNQQIIVSIPAASNAPAGTPGSPTGIVANISPNATDFVVKDAESGKSGKAIFIFATLDGTISGWSPAVGGASPTAHATLMVPQSTDGTSYTGLAIGFATVNNVGQFLLYAADGGPNRRVDVFGSDFKPVHLSDTAFTDPMIPKTFTTYGIQNIKGDIWVTYTALNKGQGGFVDHFGPDGVLKAHAAVRGPLHSPWGLAQAPPKDFGPMNNAILVGNNTPRGRINAFDPNTGEFIGPLLDTNGVPIEIDQLWGIQFGQGGAANGNPNQLFFTAGSNEYNNGLFGTVTFTPQ